MKLSRRFLMNALSLILLFFVSMANYAQLPNLTKKQMIADFDSLQALIHKYYFELPLQKRRTGLNIDKEFVQLKRKLDSAESTEQFVTIINQGLNTLYDKHTYITSKRLIKWYASNSRCYIPEGDITQNDTLFAEKYIRLSELSTDSIFAKIKCQFKAKYMNGKYYNVRPFKYNGEIIRSGEEVTHIDGIPINKFINKNHNQMSFILWDPMKKCWYSDYFKAGLLQIGRQQFTLTINNKKINLDCYKPLDIIQTDFKMIDSPKILMLDSGLLYIRMPSMQNSAWYENEFLKKYSSQVKKIIIDIRNNGGGSDGVWQDLLEKIIDKPLHWQFNVGLYHNKVIEEGIKSFGKIMVNKNKAIIDNEVILTPDSNSVKYKGKLYILQDKYSFSAAAALSSVARQNENMIQIGEPSALIVGYGFPPIMLKLPNSGLVFNLGFTADLSGGKDNPYMDKVEVPIVEDDINEYVDKVLNYDCYSRNYLIQKDKMIKYVRAN